MSDEPIIVNCELSEERLERLVKIVRLTLSYYDEYPSERPDNNKIAEDLVLGLVNEMGGSSK